MMKRVTAALLATCGLLGALLLGCNKAIDPPQLNLLSGALPQLVVQTLHRLVGASPAPCPTKELRQPLPRAAGKGDRDGDGLLDADEERIAREYLPYISVHPQDQCAHAALVYRLRPHPAAPRLLHLTAVLIFARDCGAGGHLGDNEAFGVTIDPSLPAPAGIRAIRAIAHQGTICSNTSQCGSCNGLAPCATAPRNGVPYPVVFLSRNKHGAYMSEASCNGACFWTNWCTQSPVPFVPRMVNAGEPRTPLIDNLTAAGLVTAAHGWTEPRLLNMDPWDAGDFGDAGCIARDLNSTALLTPSCSDGRAVSSRQP